MKITATQLRRIIAEEVQKMSQARRAPATPARRRTADPVAQRICDMAGVGRPADFAGVAALVKELQGNPDLSGDEALDYVSEELGNVMMDNDYDFDGFGVATEVCDEFGI